MIGLPGVRRRPVRAVGRRLLQGLRWRPRGQAGMVAAPRRHPRLLGRRSASAGASRAPRPGDLASHLLHATIDDAPLDDDRGPRHAPGARARRARHDARPARLPLPYLADTPDRPPAAGRRACADPGGRRGVACGYTRSSSATDARSRRDTEFHGCPLQARATWCTRWSPRRTATLGSTTGPTSSSSTARGVHHFGFAGGPHRCLGAHLARRELQIAVEEWLRVIPDFRLAASEPLRERGGGAMLGLLRLPLAWDVSP